MNDSVRAIFLKIFIIIMNYVCRGINVAKCNNGYFENFFVRGTCKTKSLN